MLARSESDVLGLRPAEAAGAGDGNGATASSLARDRLGGGVAPPAEALDGEPIIDWRPEQLAVVPRARSRTAAALIRVFDVAVSLVGLALLGVLLPVIAAAIAVDARGPVFFRQRRSGRGGRPFTLYKLRTMVDGAERRRASLEHLNVMNGPTFKAVADPRVTRVGRWLRRFSLDEAPQFLNVLRGEMALVGPRPLPVREAEGGDGLEQARQAVRPGMTGLWQVRGRNLVDHRQMIALDLEYVATRTVRMDLAILLLTVPAVVWGRGAY